MINICDIDETWSRVLKYVVLSVLPQESVLHEFTIYHADLEAIVEIRVGSQNHDSPEASPLALEGAGDMLSSLFLVATVQLARVSDYSHQEIELV